LDLEKKMLKTFTKIILVVLIAFSIFVVVYQFDSEPG